MRARNWSFVVVAAIAMALAVVSLFWNAHQVSADNAHWHQALAAQQRQARAEQAAQRRQGQAVEAKLCATLAPLSTLGTLHAPAGNPAANPARAFEQELVQRLQPLAQLSTDIGCRKEGGGR